MRTTISLMCGWTLGGLLLLAYFADRAVFPLWVPPVAAFGATLLAMWALKRS